MNLRQIDAFRAVMESGTVSRAAKRLSVSQPAVSKLIQNFEQAIGLVLFDRTRGRLSPTAEATMLFEEVERLFGGLSSIKTFAEEIRTLHHGSLRIGVMPALSTGFIQEVVADFVRDYPQAQISIHARSSLKLVDWLVAGHLDIGVTSHPVEHPELMQISICRRQLVCILPLGHPLAKRRKLRPVDLSGERFISFTRDSHVRQALDQIFAAGGVRAHPSGGCVNGADRLRARRSRLGHLDPRPAQRRLLRASRCGAALQSHAHIRNPDSSAAASTALACDEGVCR